MPLNGCSFLVSLYVVQPASVISIVTSPDTSVISAVCPALLPMLAITFTDFLFGIVTI